MNTWQFTLHVSFIFPMKEKNIHLSCQFYLYFKNPLLLSDGLGGTERRQVLRGTDGGRISGWKSGSEEEISQKSMGRTLVGLLAMAEHIA